MVFLVLGVEVWQFVKDVRGRLWESSVRTIVESTHQGANALNLQLEADFDELDAIWDSISELDTAEAETILNLYNRMEPDVMLYLQNAGALREGIRPDTAAGALLEEARLDRGILNAHISSVTGENVFDLFVRGTLADGTSACLVKEYRSREIARQFTLSFYDNAGFSYLINRSGTIMVRPGHRNSNKTVHNLFDMVSGQKGNSPQMVEAFRESVGGLKSGWAKFLYDGTGTVFCYEPLRADSDWLLVSIIPEPVITAQADSILQKTMLFSGIVLAVVLMLVGGLYAVKMRESREHTAQLQQALDEAARASQAKSRFLMDISHDVLTPLNAILGMAAIAGDNLQCQDRLRDCLEKIKTSGTQLLAFISDMLDMSQIEQGKIILQEETVCLPHLVEEVAGLMGDKAKDAGLTMELAPIRLRDDFVIGDPARIRQVLLNIVDNAVKYTPPGGRVSLELAQGPEDREGKGVYRFCCADTGIGMDAEFQEKIFQPFERARNTTASRIAGVGMGLAIAKRLMDLMDGSISVQSEPGGGSVFIVEFCLYAGQEPPEVELGPQTGETPDYADKRVLLVEDNELNMEILEEFVSAAGVQIEKAHDGREAAERVETNPSGYYDLILMDIQMPVMDGYEATRYIRGLEQEDRVPIYAVSANALAEDVRNAARAGMDGHIAKPVRPDAILKVMNKCFGTRRVRSRP